MTSHLEEQYQTSWQERQTFAENMQPIIGQLFRNKARVLVRGFLCERNVEVPVQAEHASQLLKAAGIRGGCIIDG